MYTENHKDSLKHRIELMEKEIPYLKGNKKVKAKKEYLELLRSLGEDSKLKEPIYLKRK